METLKKGSKGENVKVLQKALGLTADGIFGSGTEAKLIEYQKAHNLTADGICGAGTWKALGFNSDSKSSSKVVDDSVIYLPLPTCVSSLPNRDIKYLVIHFTGGSNSKPGRAQNMKNTFLDRCKKKQYASADFGVDDRDCVQFNPDPQNYYCWAVGGKSYGNKGGKFYGKAVNRNCISIEMCSTCVPSTSQAVNTDNHSGWSFTDAVVDNCRKLAKMIMKKYNIPIERVIRHYDVTGKLCPGIIGWNDEPIKDISGKKTGVANNSKKWEAFKDSLTK